MANEIDKFRENFFDTVIEIEKKKEQDDKLAQANCFHNYNLIGPIYSKSYQLRMCSKCRHSAVKRIEVWEGTKHCSIQ